MSMNIQDTRIAQLKQWFANRSFPESEKSYISQLLSKKAPFGERAARRLEKTYGMGLGYLDAETAQPSGEAGAGPDDLRKAVRLLELFQRADERGRDEILLAAELLVAGDDSARVDRNDV